MSYTRYVTKGCPLLEEFNRIILQTLEAVVMQKLRLDMKETVHQRGLTEACADEAYSIQSLSHLQLVFYMLMIGHTATFMLFMTELLIGRPTLRAAF
jgi:hypothetical protein